MLKWDSFEDSPRACEASPAGDALGEDEALSGFLASSTANHTGPRGSMVTPLLQGHSWLAGGYFMRHVPLALSPGPEEAVMSPQPRLSLCQCWPALRLEVGARKCPRSPSQCTSDRCILPRFLKILWGRRAAKGFNPASA